MKDRRIFSRYFSQLKAKYFLTDKRIVWEECTIINISRKGMAIKLLTHEKIDVGSIIHLGIFINLRMESFTIKGTLKWIEKEVNCFVGGIEETESLEETTSKNMFSIESILKTLVINKQVTKEKRSCPRFNIAVKVQDSATLKARWTKNLSSGGCLIDRSEGFCFLKKDSRLLLTFAIPEEDEPLVISGVLRHTVKYGQGLGIKFEAVDEKSAYCIEKFLGSLQQVENKEVVLLY